jgi:hypothetical protein
MVKATLMIQIAGNQRQIRWGGDFGQAKANSPNWVKNLHFVVCDQRRALDGLKVFFLLLLPGRALRLYSQTDRT